MSKQPPTKKQKRESKELCKLRFDIWRQIDHVATKLVFPKVNIDTLPTFSHKEVVWICHNKSEECKCGHIHTWIARVYARTKVRGTGCPYCSGHKVCPCNTLKAKMPNLFAQIDQNATKLAFPDVSIDELFVSSSARVMWVCSEGGKCNCKQPHTWITHVYRRTSKESGCPYCAGTRVCKCGTLKVQRPDIFAEIDVDATRKAFPNVNIEELAVSSGKAVVFKCPNDYLTARFHH